MNMNMYLRGSLPDIRDTREQELVSGCDPQKCWHSKPLSVCWAHTRTQPVQLLWHDLQLLWNSGLIVAPTPLKSPSLVSLA